MKRNQMPAYLMTYFQVQLLCSMIKKLDEAVYILDLYILLN